MTKYQFNLPPKYLILILILIVSRLKMGNVSNVSNFIGKTKMEFVSN